MTTKEWLRRARYIDREISSLLEARQVALARAVSATAAPQKICVKSSGGGGGLPDVYIMLEDKINQRIDELLTAKSEILEVISRVDNATYRQLLTEYYINCKTWEQVAVQMDYGWRQVMRMHGRALQEVEAKMS